MVDRSSAGQDEVARLIPPPVSRRAFLAGAAACAAAGPALLRAAAEELGSQAFLHVATGTSHNGYVHTFALTSDGCRLLGSVAVDACAALAPHPVLPVLYAARDCRQWEDLPRGVVETYAVARNARPLRLLTRTPMALSATGPRSLAVSSCGRHLLVSASNGGAWNAFALDRSGMPASIAIARKETGTTLNAHALSLPTPHGLAFSPRGPFALGTDPGSERVTLLRPSPDGIAVLTRCQAPHGLSLAHPVWTANGRYAIVANARSASLSVYEMQGLSGEEASIHLLGTTSTVTPVTGLLAHPVEAAIFTSRPHGSSSRLELWTMHATGLRLADDTSISGHVVALAQHANGLWVASQDRLIQIPIGDLRTPYPLEVPLPMRGVRAISVQRVAANRAAGDETLP